MDPLQPVVSFMSLAVSLYAVNRARRNGKNRLTAYLFLAIAAFLAFQSLSYIDLLPIETAHTVAFSARVLLLLGLLVFVRYLRSQPVTA